MMCNVLSIVMTVTFGVLVSAIRIPHRKSVNSARMTPHDQYSSSIGVLGCKINTNRVAYWPGPVDCNNICVRTSYEGREVHLLRIDSSEGAYDISYDAWNYLVYGKSATEDPRLGGGEEIQYEFVDPGNCEHLLDNGALPLSAANSMNYVSSCLLEPQSWVAHHYVLYNIFDPVCKYGANEKCWLETDCLPICPSGLGALGELGLKVENIMYGTGELVPA
ncbi:hypothetical protein BGZ63DRAFT_172908 [Mariannaea sp. PMI_226]|nr:hypothetical protein BGZ63DRAFT_172908 [Mariannaea sp. PMI_226]